MSFSWSVSISKSLHEDMLTDRNIVRVKEAVTKSLRHEQIFTTEVRPHFSSFPMWFCKLLVWQVTKQVGSGGGGVLKSSE